ncbi:MAG: hypothetical protein JGK08_09070 [Microcoleus sp. PH2017_04_SCI_O_A]|nr:hypothetical protein [Microcoleus sp. PH2017_04_SCI_O_A]
MVSEVHRNPVSLRNRVSTVNCQLSTVNCQLSTVNCQLCAPNTSKVAF